MKKLAKEDLINAFLKGECSDQELAELREWLVLPENQEEAESLFKTSWKEMQEEEPLMDFDKDVMLAGIKSKIRETEPKRERVSDRPPYAYQRKSRIPTSIKATVGLVLIVLMSYLIMPKDQVTQPDLIEQVTREAPRGFRNTVKLPDGSSVTLNAGSTISYAKNFGVTDRVIHLSGEAFFSVIRDETKPFEVISNDLKTTALGTSFNVNAYQKNAEAISLATGKVKVERINDNTNKSAQEEMILEPGEQALWNESKAYLVKKKFDFLRTLSWKSNVIYFNNTDLRSMIDVLEKWYDVSIRISGGGSDKLTQTGTGTFKNESLENVLISLGFTMGFDYEINEEKITLNLTND